MIFPLNNSLPSYVSTLSYKNVTIVLKQGDLCFPKLIFYLKNKVFTYIISYYTWRQRRNLSKIKVFVVKLLAIKLMCKLLEITKIQ